MFIKKIKLHKKSRCFIFIFSLFFMGHAYAAKGLSLDEYLCQVRNHNAGVNGSVLIAKGAKMRVGEGRLIMSPTLFAEGQYLKNSYDPNWSPIVGNSNSLQNYKVGVSQTTPYGLQGRIYYNYQHQNVNATSPLVNQAQITASSPILELDLPLSRNLAGRETRAAAQLIDSQACLTHHSEQYKNQMLMAQAESAYWRLATLRAVVMKQKESLDRAVKIYQWVEKRAQLRLAENSDVLQAQAGVANKELDIQSAINDEKIAALNFNTLRGSCQENVYEHLCSFNCDIISRIRLPDCPGLREDVLVAKQQERIAIANAQLGIEKNKPDLNLYASYALNGNNPSSNQAIAESFSTNYPSTAIGLRLSLPLNFCQLHKDRLGYKNEIKGAKCQFKQKVFDNQRLWENIILKIQNAQQRFHLAQQLEFIQSKKLNIERKRLSMGKTTTYQVLMFEQDYANSQITCLAIQDEILEWVAQLKTFGV